MNITKGTAVRIVALILALINQQLTKHGISPIPSDDQMLSDIVVWIIGAYTPYNSYDSYVNFGQGGVWQGWKKVTTVSS